jgi:hypothetical protein
MKSLGLPLGAYNVAWAVVTIWMAKSNCWALECGSRLGTLHLSKPNLKGRTHNQPIK